MMTARKMARVSRRLSHHLTTAQDVGERNQRLIEELLELARQGDDVGEVHPVEVGMLVESCWRTVQSEESTLTVDEDWAALADPTCLRQLLQNLFENAVNHGGDGVKVTIWRLERGFTLRLMEEISPMRLVSVFPSLDSPERPMGLGSA